MDEPIPQLIEPLTGREHDIMRLIADGQTNREIADGLVISVNTVRWYNKQIYAKLGVHSRTSAIAHANTLGLLDEHTPGTPDAALHHLPAQLTAFIGRRREIEAISQLLASGRLLTLTGPGGTGKTRLSIKVAEAIAADFADGVHFIDLAPIGDPALVPQAIAAALDVIENPNEPLPETLKRVLAEQERLLLIDNYEHVIEAAPLVADLLAAAPRLKILVTSRETLRLSGEQEYPVPPLSLPADETASLEAVTQSEAVTLFLQRARMARPGFALDESNAATIAQICTRLDGLPLAIELAAARCKLLTPQALLTRLNSRLTTLTGGSRDAPSRQRTLRDTIDWSYNLLDDSEKILFARLAVFRGGRSLEAVEAVCADGLTLDVFDGLASLLDKSMIRQVEDTAGEPRFVMLETIHEYAHEQLEASGEAEAIRRRHADYYVDLAERAEPELRLAQQERWFQLLETEHDNLREAMAWALSGIDAQLGLRLVATLHDFWFYEGHHIEGQRWIDHAYEYLEDVLPTLRARVLFSAAHIAYARQDERFKQLSSEALALFRAQGDQRNTGWALIVLSAYAEGQPEEYDAAIVHCEAGLALLRELDDRPGIAQALNILGNLTGLKGDYPRAKAAYAECLTISRETGERRRESMSLDNLGRITLYEGDHEQAAALIKEGLALAWELDFKVMAVSGLAMFAGPLVTQGQPERAARFLGAAAERLHALGIVYQPNTQPVIDGFMSDIRAQLDEVAFKAAWDEGRTWSLARAVDEALRD